MVMTMDIHCILITNFLRNIIRIMARNINCDPFLRIDINADGRNINAKYLPVSTNKSIIAGIQILRNDLNVNILNDSLPAIIAKPQIIN